MKLYHVTVKPECRSMYFPDFLHDNIGYCWQKDEDHVWFKFIHKSTDGNAYLSSPNRFCWSDVEIHSINVIDSEEITQKDFFLTVE